MTLSQVVRCFPFLERMTYRQLTRYLPFFMGVSLVFCLTNTAILVVGLAAGTSLWVPLTAFLFGWLQYLYNRRCVNGVVEDREFLERAGDLTIAELLKLRDVSIVEAPQLPSFSRLWWLMGIAFPPKFRERVWAPAIEEDKADYFAAMHQNDGNRWARSWIRLCFVVRTLIRLGQALWAITAIKLVVWFKLALFIKS